MNTPTSPKFYLPDDAPIQPTRPALEEGTRLLDGRFILLKELGFGKRSTVYQTQDSLRNGEIIVLKAIELVPGDSHPLESRYRRQLHIQQTLNDFQHILRIYDLHEIPYHGAQLLVQSQEYADGSNFRDWLCSQVKDSSQRLSQGLEMFLQFCFGVASAGEQGILHLNLKKENLLVVKGVGKVTDFMDGPMEPSHDRAVGTTPEYWSPEQFYTAKPTDLDLRSDVYSLVVLLFELVHPSGRPPFQGTYAELREQHTRSPLPDLSAIPAGLRRCIQRGLQKKPADRYADVNELLDDLAGKSPRSIRGENGSSQSQKNPLFTLTPEIQSCIKAHKFNQARILCRNYLENHPHHLGVQNQLQRLDELYRKVEEFYDLLGHHMNQLTLQELAEGLQAAATTFPNHPAGRLIQKRILLRSGKFRALLEQAMQSKSNLPQSLLHLAKAKELDPNSKTLDLIFHSLSRRQEAREQAQNRLHEEIKYFLPDPRRIDPS